MASMASARPAGRINANAVAHELNTVALPAPLCQSLPRFDLQQLLDTAAVRCPPALHMLMHMWLTLHPSCVNCATAVWPLFPSLSAHVIL